MIGSSRVIRTLGLAASALAALVAFQAYAGDDDSKVCDAASASPSAGVVACTKLLDFKRDSVNLSAVYNNRGTAWIALGNFDNAIADLSEAINRDPGFAVAFLNRGVAYFNKSEIDRAIKDTSEAIRFNPNLASAYNLRGNLLSLKQEPSRALLDFDKMIALEPSNPRGYTNRGYALQTDSRYSEALTAFDKAIQLAPSDAENYAGRAVVFLSLGEFDKAAKEYSAAIKKDARNVRYYTARGETWRQKGELNSALEDHNKALEIAPNDKDALNNRALVWRDKGDLDKAIADYNEAILIDPNYSRAYGNRGEIWRLKGNIDRAITDFDQAIKLEPEGPVFYIHRGEMWRFSGEIERALGDFDKALTIRPDDVAALVGRGLTYEKQGDIWKARADFEKALKFHPDKNPAMDRPAQETAQARLAALGAIAEPGKAHASRGRRVALVIGNSNYRSVPALPNPSGDAKAVADTLNSVGFDKVTLKLDLTREEMEDALHAFAKDASVSDWAMIYYAGHGMEVDGNNFLIPIDTVIAGPEAIAKDTVSINDVLVAVDLARKLKLVVLDACRDNPFLRAQAQPVLSSRAVESPGAREVQRNESVGLGQISPGAGTLVVYAAKHGQLALDGTGKNSPFVAAFVDRVSRPHVEITKLFRLVRDDVMDVTRGQQEPFTYGSLSGREDFYFLDSTSSQPSGNIGSKAANNKLSGTQKISRQDKALPATHRSPSARHRAPHTTTQPSSAIRTTGTEPARRPVQSSRDIPSERISLPPGSF